MADIGSDREMYGNSEIFPDSYGLGRVNRREVAQWWRNCDDRFETALPRQGAGECRMAAKIWV